MYLVNFVLVNSLYLFFFHPLLISFQSPETIIKQDIEKCSSSKFSQFSSNYLSSPPNTIPVFSIHSLSLSRNINNWKNIVKTTVSFYIFIFSFLQFITRQFGNKNFILFFSIFQFNINLHLIIIKIRKYFKYNQLQPSEEKTAKKGPKPRFNLSFINGMNSQPRLAKPRATVNQKMFQI